MEVTGDVTSERREEVNLSKLKAVIIDRGVKRSAVAEAIGCTRYSVYKKLDGKTEFKASEIVKLSEFLRLSPEERDSIFFGE